MFRKLVTFTLIALAMLFGLTGIGHQIESQSNGMICWAENKSYTTTCAEEDNVNVPIFGPQVSRFSVIATHPTYAIDVDNCAPDFSGCNSTRAKSHTMVTLLSQAALCPVETELWNDGITIVKACSEQDWWRPYFMTVVVGELSVSAHRLILYRKIQDEASWPQFLVLYEDGNLRLKPHKKVGGPDPCFGSSVIVGPAPLDPSPKPRPYVDIQEVQVNPAALSLDIIYRNGAGTAHVDLSVDRSKAVAKVTVGYSTSTHIPFATFRSMYVTNGNADVDHIQTQDGDLGILSNWASLQGLWWFFHRKFWSRHNTSAPDIRIVVDTPAVFRVERTGNVFAEGAFFPGVGADVAERIDVSESVEPGDVVELDPGHLGQYRKARQAYSQLVAGVISRAPGVTLANRSMTDNQPFLALLGRVYVKVSVENGPIRPGDLLVSSSIPGYAMRCVKAAECERAIIGKALESLEEGTGFILMLVMH